MTTYYAYLETGVCIKAHGRTEALNKVRAKFLALLQDPQSNIEFLLEDE